MGWQYYQLEHMQIVCTSFHIAIPAAPSQLIVTGWMLFVMWVGSTLSKSKG